MDIHLLGSIASIISFFIPLGFIFWSLIKKKKISFFNLYILVLVLIQAISVGHSLWNGKNLMAMMAGMFLMFTILFWLVMHLSDRLLEIIKSQQKIIEDINHDMEKLTNLFGESIEIIRELTKLNSIKIDINTEQLEDELKKLQRKISKNKSFL